MRLRYQIGFGLLVVVVSLGCQSQGGPPAATLSLQGQAYEAERAIYHQVDLIEAAGSGAEEDEPDASEQDPQSSTEAGSPDAGLEEEIAEITRLADDSPLCGNGELDEGELCDFAIREGDGACPEVCTPKPGCPDEVLVVHGCATHCMAQAEPSEECLQVP